MANSVPKILPKINSNSFRPMTDRLRQSIVNDIVDSLSRFGVDQSRAVRESETARIARKRKVTNLQVGGVRSNLNRGAYGSVTNLVKNYRKSVSAGS